MSNVNNVAFSVFERCKLSIEKTLQPVMFFSQKMEPKHKNMMKNEFHEFLVFSDHINQCYKIDAQIFCINTLDCTFIKQFLA